MEKAFSQVTGRQNLTAANFITSLRIVGTFILMFLKPMTTAFFTVYTLTGITDVLDGFIARITRTASKFGAKLDSVADLLLYSVMILKILPHLKEMISSELQVAIAVILIIRICAYVLAAIKYRQFASLHTILNKICGFCVFCVPYLALLPFATYAFWVICAVAALASVEELFIHWKRNGVKTDYCRKIRKIR